MNTWLNANADGIALMVIIAVIGALLLVGALCIERLVEPRHEREFDHMSRSSRGRRAQAERSAPLPRPTWTPPSGWVDQR